MATTSENFKKRTYPVEPAVGTSPPPPGRVGVSLTSCGFCNGTLHS